MKNPAEKIVETLLEAVAGIVHYDAGLYDTDEGNRIESEVEEIAAKFGGEFDGTGTG